MADGFSDLAALAAVARGLTNDFKDLSSQMSSAASAVSSFETSLGSIPGVVTSLISSMNSVSADFSAMSGVITSMVTELGALTTASRTLSATLSGFSIPPIVIPPFAWPIIGQPTWPTITAPTITIPPFVWPAGIVPPFVWPRVPAPPNPNPTPNPTSNPTSNITSKDVKGGGGGHNEGMEIAGGVGLGSLVGILQDSTSRAEGMASEADNFFGILNKMWGVMGASTQTETESVRNILNEGIQEANKEMSLIKKIDMGKGRFNYQDYTQEAESILNAGIRDVTAIKSLTTTSLMIKKGNVALSESFVTMGVALVMSGKLTAGKVRGLASYMMKQAKEFGAAINLMEENLKPFGELLNNLAAGGVGSLDNTMKSLTVFAAETAKIMQASGQTFDTSEIATLVGNLVSPMIQTSLKANVQFSLLSKEMGMTVGQMVDAVKGGGAGEVSARASVAIGKLAKQGAMQTATLAAMGFDESKITQYMALASKSPEEIQKMYAAIRSSASDSLDATKELRDQVAAQQIPWKDIGANILSQSIMLQNIYGFLSNIPIVPILLGILVLPTLFNAISGPLKWLVKFMNPIRGLQFKGITYLKDIISAVRSIGPQGPPPQGPPPPPRNFFQRITQAIQQGIFNARVATSGVIGGIRANPIVSRVIGGIQTGVKTGVKVARGAYTVGSAVGRGVRGVAKTGGAIIGGAVKVGMGAAALGAGLVALPDIIRKLSGGDQKGQEVASKIENMIGTFMKTVGPMLMGLLKQLVAMIDPFLPTIQTALESLGTSLGSLLGKSGPLPGLMTAVLSVLPPLLKLIAPLITMLVSIVTAFAPLLQTLANVLVQVMPPIVEAITGAMTQLGPVFEQLGVVIGDLFKTLGPIIANLITALLPVIVSLITMLVPVISSIVSVLGPILTTVIETVVGIITQVMPIITSILGPILSLITPLMNLFKNLMGALMPIIRIAFALILPIVRVLLPIVIKMVVWVVNFIVGIVSGVLGFIGKFLGPAGKDMTNMSKEMIKTKDEMAKNSSPDLTAASTLPGDNKKVPDAGSTLPGDKSSALNLLNNSFDNKTMPSDTGNKVVAEPVSPIAPITSSEGSATTEVDSILKHLPLDVQDKELATAINNLIAVLRPGFQSTLTGSHPPAKGVSRADLIRAGVG